MTEKRCPSCGCYRPLAQIRRKRLLRGGVRLICLACIVKAKLRTDEVPPNYGDPA